MTMSLASSPDSERTAGDLCIGFTGHRKLADETATTARITQALRRLVGDAGSATAVTSVAAGADTLFAEAAIGLGLRLQVLLPFPLRRFRDDFDERQWERVQAILGHADRVQVIGPHGPRDPDRDREAYWRTGLATLKHADAMIAVWDGRASGGRGGTAEVVQEARRRDRPLVWIHADDGSVQCERLTDTPLNAKPRKRRILSIDGGGIRGVLALRVLRHIERVFREQAGDPTLTLADRFDLIAGTSTGAIIATALSWGMSVDEVEDLYENHGHEMFHKEKLRRRWKNKYRGDALESMFRQVFRESDGSDPLLGSSQLRTLLLLILRNATTGSCWPVTNNPHSLYNAPGTQDCNLHVPLWQLLRASAAAPSYFPPQSIRFGEQAFTFVDGGITPYNNPALLAVLTATLPSYRVNWPTGVNRLHVVSVGTGLKRTRLPGKAVGDVHLFDHLRFVVPALLDSVARQQDLTCRVLGRCLFGEPIDSEVGDLHIAGLLPPGDEMFSYARYDPRPPNGPMADAFDRLSLDNVRAIAQMQEIGEAYAATSVQPDHLDFADA